MSTDPKGSEKPSCYGSSEWDAKDPVCRGGYDPAYTDAKGSHVREECIYFRACGLEQMARQRQSSLVPVSNLVRPTVPQPQAIRQVYQQTSPPPTPQPYQQSVAVAPHQVQGMQLMPVSYVMPGYLTTAQDPGGGVGIFRAAAGDAIRAGLKGALHQLAHFVDKQPFFLPTPQGTEEK